MILNSELKSIYVCTGQIVFTKGHITKVYGGGLKNLSRFRPIGFSL